MALYYFLGTLLPDLKIGQVPEISFNEFSFLLQNHLRPGDLAQTVTLRRYFDLENLRASWRYQPLDPHGNLDENSLEEAILSGVGLPAYVYDFLEKYKTEEERLSHFGSLLSAYFCEEEATGFVGQFLKKERDIRLVVAALRAKSFDRDVVREMQYEERDELVAQIVAQKDAVSYEPPEEFKELKEIFIKTQNQPLALYKALLEYRFNQMERIVGLQRFTLERLLAYLYQLILCEKWLKLDRTKGGERLQIIMQGAA